MNSSAHMILTQLLVQLPNLLVYLAGGVGVMLMWKHSPRACTFVAIAITLLLLLMFAMPIVHQAIIQMSQEDGFEHSNVQMWFTVSGVVSSCLHALSTGLLIVAAFIGRSRGGQGS